MRCCLSDKSGSNEGINHTKKESETCPRDYCHSWIPWDAIPANEKMATAIANGGGMLAKGKVTNAYDPILSKKANKPGMYRVMTKECHENFLRTCLEPWGPRQGEEMVGGHFFGGSSTWKCAPECNKAKGIITDCGPDCLKKQQENDKKFGGDVSPISSMCRTWAYIQPRVFNASVAPKVCKLPSKTYIDSIYSTLQDPGEKGVAARRKIQNRLEFPLCRDYWQRNFEKFKVPLTNICDYMFKRNCTGKFDKFTNTEICNYPTLKQDPTYGWRPDLNGKLGEMLHKAQACGCHLPYGLRKARLEKEFKGHMKPMIAFKLAQNPMCADDSCKTYGLGAPQSYLDVIDRCMCNLNVQICDQKIKDTDTKKKEEPASPTPWYAEPKKPQINVQVCKFDKGAAGISSDDWVAMGQCGINQKMAQDMAALQKDLLTEVKAKAAAGADEMANPLKTGNESIISTTATTCKRGFCKPTMDQGGTQLEGEADKDYKERMNIPKLEESDCKKNTSAKWTPTEKCDGGKKCPDCGKKVCPCPIDPDVAKLTPTSKIDKAREYKKKTTTTTTTTNRKGGSSAIKSVGNIGENVGKEIGIDTKKTIAIIFVVAIIGMVGYFLTKKPTGGQVMVARQY